MYLYLRPGGGFNDILCGIAEMLAYCIKYKRTFLVDGSNAAYKVNFANYFDISGTHIIYDKTRIDEICKTITTVYPLPLTGRLLDFISGKIQVSYVKNTGLAYFGGIFVLPSSEREEQLIVYARCGGGKGYDIFQHLKFSTAIKNECKKRYDQMEKPYIAIHIRNTDYKCDYASLYRANHKEIRRFKHTYIATDDKGTIDFFRAEGLDVKNFTTFPTTSYNSLHKSGIDPHTKMIDLLCDLYITAMSSKLLSNSKGGFIRLIRNCHENKAALEEQFRI